MRFGLPIVSIGIGIANDGLVIVFIFHVGNVVLIVVHDLSVANVAGIVHGAVNPAAAYVLAFLGSVLSDPTKRANAAHEMLRSEGAVAPSPSFVLSSAGASARIAWTLARSPAAAAAVRSAMSATHPSYKFAEQLS